MLHNKKAVLWDLDGCLVSMPSGHHQALNKALNIFGYNIEIDDHLKKYNGLPTNEKLKMMSEYEGLPLELHNIIKEKKKEYTKEQIKIRCKPDYAKILMLKYLREQGMKLACCSNAIQVSVEEMLQRARLKEYFDLIIGNDVGYKPKPAPDIYLAAMKKLDLKPEECIIIEDAPYGIEAGKASGAEVIEVSGYDDVDLSLFLGN